MEVQAIQRRMRRYRKREGLRNNILHTWQIIFFFVPSRNRQDQTRNLYAELLPLDDYLLHDNDGVLLPVFFSTTRRWPDKRRREELFTYVRERQRMDWGWVILLRQASIDPISIRVPTYLWMDFQHMVIVGFRVASTTWRQIGRAIRS